MNADRLSVARTVLLAGLVFQVIGIIIGVSRVFGWGPFFQSIINGQVDTTMALLMLLGAGVIFVPAARGRKWALGTALALHALLALGAIQAITIHLAHPQDFIS